MLIFGEPVDTLPTRVRKDASTNLPLISEQDAIFKIILTYLALPYSVAEYGCGKKCSLIIERLTELGVPPWAISRGLAIESDMSPEAMACRDMAGRPAAITLRNPIAELGDLSDARLRRMLETQGFQVDEQARTIQVGRFTLHHRERVQLAESRSHIFPVVLFWDAANGRVVERVVDPTLDGRSPFDLTAVRDYLHAPESLILTAPLFGHFRLHEALLTAAQRRDVSRFLGRQPDATALLALARNTHNALVCELNGAQPDSVGDPQCWTYANNFHGHDETHTAVQRELTGRGDELRDKVGALIRARETMSHDVGDIRSELDQWVLRADARKLLRDDAVWSEKRLESLADMALTIVYYNALRHLAGRIDAGACFVDELRQLRRGSPYRGIGARLRRRIDAMSVVSVNEQGEIDARALNQQFCETAVETAQQMHEAGLSVFVDKVGNLHGLLLADDEREALSRSEITLTELLRDAVCHFSHIDTVSDAGKFDGRLGVAGGIETAHLIQDLKRYYDIDTASAQSPVRLQVSAFVGEEMTFTGEGVSMPGSAAMCGNADPGRIHAMTNGNGERYGERLAVLMRRLQQAVDQGEVHLAHELNGDGDALLNSCVNPSDFFTPHTYERHIEQGPILDRQNVPIALVGRIMGIHQEDFYLRGDSAEHAALALNCAIRDFAMKPPFNNTRATVGIVEPRGEAICYPSVGMALRCVLDGEKNHAGATETADRKDPGVAMGRLARHFQHWCKQRGEKLAGARALVGDVVLEPGTGRNVIPGRAAATFALHGSDFDEQAADAVFRELRSMAVGELSAEVAAGGEGVQIRRMEPVSFVNSNSEVRVSLDLRDDDASTITEFRRWLAVVRTSLEAAYGVTITSSVEQVVQPSDLEPSGQVLLMERSYGGSHNPNETELMMDLTRGCLLQYAVMADVLRRESMEGVNLFAVTESFVPAPWLEALPRFTSGALHDTCNVVMRLQRAREASAGGESGRGGTRRTGPMAASAP